MLGKTLILGLISAGAAGAMVYYGTAPQGSEALEAHPSDLMQTEMPVKKANERIEPRLPTVRKADNEDGRQKLGSSERLPVSTEVMPTETSDAEPKKQMRWLDQYLKNNESEPLKTEDDESDVEVAIESGASDTATNSYTVNEHAVINDIEPIDDVVDSATITEAGPTTKPAVTDQRTFRIEDGKLVEINPNLDVSDREDIEQMEEAQKTSEMHDEMMADTKPYTEKMKDKDEAHNFMQRDMANMANDSTPLLATVMKEAAAITKPELRDQAYFEITEFALSEGRYDSALVAHDLIEQDELSYTAKSRIAVTYAQNGQPTKAFKIIGKVEEAELRDFMRLQVIEALIAPENLPQTWQEKAN